MQHPYFEVCNGLDGCIGSREEEKKEKIFLETCENSVWRKRSDIFISSQKRMRFVNFEMPFFKFPKPIKSEKLAL